MDWFANSDLKSPKKVINSGFVLQGADVAPGIPVKERVRVSQNWKNGRCRRDVLLKWKCNLMPWLQLDGNVLYFTQAEEIRAHQLHTNGGRLHKRPFFNEDVCRFVISDSHIISGGREGKIALHNLHSTASIQFSAHEQDVNCVDCHGRIIVSGSRDRTARPTSPKFGKADSYEKLEKLGEGSYATVYKGKSNCMLLVLL
ncbi:unnamed protein product [Ranitomeya imitator]|uniref:Uncharacterized protein n=1 Tax=Ranitomeya imitator TaxID=111125 RepID=A0ABN9KZ07_9NEOB|nr:unnamed protein product [Ranitomeya imitator]